MLLAGSAYAQEALTSFQEPDRVVVTGSLIPTAEEVTATPVDTFGQREIERSGSVQVLEILQKREADITGAGNLGSTNANNAAGATQGGSVVSIRGLPTLILYEGRRIADSAAISTGGLQFGDVSLFPASLVSRIEVLKDGASALYGSDAVGGVINIFLKHDYQGAEIGYRYGFTPASGTQNTLVYVIAGTGNEQTNISVGYQYYQTSGLFQRERAYSSPTFGTSQYGGVAQDGVTSRRYFLDAGLNSPFDVAGVIPGSQTALNRGALANAYTRRSGQFIVDNFDLSRLPTSTLLQNDQNFIASFTHDIVGKRLELFGDVLDSNNHNKSVLNAQPLSTLANPGVIIPAGHVSTGPGDPTIYNPFNFTINFGNPDGTPPPVIVYNRYQMNPRPFTNDTNFIRLLGGLRSQITKDYSFETAYYYSNYRIAFVNANLVNGAQLNEMIAGTARDLSGNLIPPLDFFALNPIGTGPGQVSAAQFATIFGTNIRNEVSNQKVIDAKLTGFPFKLPAGLFGFALGGEYRTEGYSVKDSPEIFVQSVPIQEINTSRAIYAAYLELSIPLVSPQQKIPGIYSMDLTLAGRHEHYDGVSQDANVPKVTFRYQPMQDLTLRASFANSFVAPNLYQLYGPSSSGFSPPIALPPAPMAMNGPGQQVPVLSGSNPNLLPSTAQSYSAGLVYSPKWARGLTISADYFNVLQQSTVGTIGGQVILPSVNLSGRASPYYGLVHVGSFAGPLISPTSGPFGNGTYVIANSSNIYYIDNNVNVGSTRVTGWDFSISYTCDLKRFGTLQLGANAVLYVNNDFRQFSYSPYQSVKGVDGSENVGGNPQYRVNMLAEYRYQGWTLGFTFSYIPAMYSSLLNPLVPDYKNLPDQFQRIAAYNQSDSYLKYTIATPHAVAAPKTVVDPKGVPVRTQVDTRFRWYDGLTLSVGCNNLFNHQPPFISGANGNTDLSFYDPYGRLVYFRVSKKF
jgi:iron complex outermembrane recepter protein